MRLIIDSGHRDNPADPGAVGLVVEADRNIAIKNALRKWIDFEEDPDGTGSLANTIKWINARFTTDDLLISIHTNAGGGDGIEIWYYKDSEPSRKKAADGCAIIARETGDPNRGAKDEKNCRYGQFGIIHDTKPWAFLVECDFVDDPTGDVTGNVEAYARGIALWLRDSFGFTLKDQTPPPAPQPEVVPTPTLTPQPEVVPTPPAEPAPVDPTPIIVVPEDLPADPTPEVQPEPELPPIPEAPASPQDNDIEYLRALGVVFKDEANKAELGSSIQKLGQFIMDADFHGGGIWLGIKKWLKVFAWVSGSAIFSFGLQRLTGYHFHDLRVLDTTITSTELNLASVAFVNGFGTGFLKWIGTKTEKAKNDCLTV